MQDELSIAKADVAILVEERNKLLRELEEYKALYTDVAKKLNNANYRLSQIGDLAGGRGGLTMRAADLRHACGDCGEELQIVRPGKYQCVNPKCGASR